MENIEIGQEEYQRMVNDYQSYISNYVDGFVSNLFSQGIINEVDADTLKKYFSNPDQFQKEIEDLTQYYYITSSEVHQMYELIESLPTLNYKIDSYDKPDNNDENISLINKTMHKVKHRSLSRDVLKQTSSSGTLVGIWLGGKNKLYPMIFDDLKHVFPAYRGANGDWVCVMDLAYFNSFSDDYRNIQFNNLSPFVTNKIYNDYLADKTKKQYIELPQERTFTLQTGTLKRNQNMGTAWSTAGMYDVLHKKKLKDVEQSIANKVINAVAVLTIGHIGTDKKDDLTNLKLPSPLKKKVHSGVKAALEKNNEKGVTVVTIPDFAKLEFPDVSYETPANKFNAVNADIKSAFGLPDTSSSTTEVVKLSMESFYKRIGVILESIESEMYQKMINLILPKKLSDNYFIVYDKEMPLSMKEKVDILVKLNDKGWSTKQLVDNLSGISWESYLEDTMYETEILKLQERIRPYLQSSTLSSNDVSNLTGATEPTTE